MRAFFTHGKETPGGGGGKSLFVQLKLQENDIRITQDPVIVQDSASHINLHPSTNQHFEK